MKIVDETILRTGRFWDAVTKQDRFAAPYVVGLVIMYVLYIWAVDWAHGVGTATLYVKMRRRVYTI